MADYVKFFNTDKYADVCFYIEHEKPFAVGEKMNGICEDAYMNGYNWEALFNYYLKNNAPELLDGMKTDPEAGMYAAYYDLSPENEKKAEKFAALIIDLVEHEDKLYDLIREHGNEIEWD